MANAFITENIGPVIRARSRPGITLWNRLEGRPRADKFDRALRAEVRDPLWMLTRQWQMGEFRGDDAGSPIFAKVHLEHTQLRKFQPANGPVQDFNYNIPLEPQVERLPVVFGQRQTINGVASDLDVSLDVRLLMGRQWLKMIAPVSAASVPEFIAAYPVHQPDPTQPADFAICAHQEAWANFQAAATRLMDGAKLYLHLTASAANHASDGIATLAGMDAQVDPIAVRFVAWFKKLFYQPEPPPDISAWVPDRLEYQFAASAPQGAGEKVFVAEEYYHGHLDWYNFDIDPDRRVLGETPTSETPKPETLTMLPVQVTFNGMPNTRWWRFEDGGTNFGDVKPDTTDLAKLLLVEFALVYANDWFLIPFTVPAGTVVRIRGAAVTNVFGERIWVRAAGAGDDDDWQRWAMFLLSTRGEGHQAADLSLLLPPAVQQALEGRPLDEVLLARDEMANMVWSIERTIPLPSGEPKNGREAAYETRSFYERDLERRLGAPPQPLPPAEGAKVRYQVMSSVPENWIPMIPVHVPGDIRETQLQRAAMLRILIGDTDPTPDAVRPRSFLLRQGLDQATPEKYILQEEEVRRAGTYATRTFNRTRWRDGRVWVWLAARKRTGRGESSSGLAFDRLIDLPPAE